MDEQLSATIIPFPVRRRVTSDPAQTSVRLSTALTSLTAALNEQRDALQRWRAALADLQDRMQTIGRTAG